MFNFGVFISCEVDGQKQSHLCIVRDVPSDVVATASAWANRIVNLPGRTFKIEDAVTRYLSFDLGGYLYGFRFANGDAGIGFIAGSHISAALIRQELPPGANFDDRFIMRYIP